MKDRQRLWMPLLAGLAGLAVAVAIRPTYETRPRQERAKESPPISSAPTVDWSFYQSWQPGEPVAGFDEALPASPARPPQKEKEFYRIFQRIAQDDPVALDRAATAVLGGAGPENEKVAILKALRDDPSPEVLRHFATALHAGPTLADVAVRFLSKRAAADPPTRAFLESQVWDEPWTAGPELRRKTVRMLFTFATPDEASRLSSRLMTETDADLVEDVAPALRRFGRLEGLAWSHPDGRVRARLEALLLPVGETADASSLLPEGE